MGTIVPIKEIAEISLHREIPFLVDCAQTAGAVNIDINLEKYRNCILAFTGHKSLLGPTGTGGMCIGQDTNIQPIIFGGTGSKSDQDIQPDFLPDRLESGTINIIGLMGLKAGVDFILKEGVEKIRNHEKNLLEKFLTGAQNIDKIKIFGPNDPERQVGLISFKVENISPSEIGFILDRKYSIMCRIGLHCNPSAHKTIGTFPDGTVRFGFSYFNTVEQVDNALNALDEIVNKMTN